VKVKVKEKEKREERKPTHISTTKPIDQVNAVYWDEAT
jgi:hypothetical protein